MRRRITAARSAAHAPLPSWRTLLLIFAPAFVLLGLVVVVHVIADVPVEDITEDPTATLDAHPLTGFQSVVGSTLWWVAASISLFSVAVLRRRGGHADSARFLLAFGLFSALLAVDDQFLIHEDLAWQYLGLRQAYIALIYPVITLVLLAVFRKIIMRSEWGLLALAFGLLASSLATDYLYEKHLLPATGLETIDAVVFLEDGFKILGIVAWAAYLSRFSLDALTDPAAEERAEEA